MSFQDERPKERFIPNPQARLGDPDREVMRFKHYALRTEQTYWSWIRQYIFFHHKRVLQQEQAAGTEKEAPALCPQFPKHVLNRQIRQGREITPG